MNVHPIRARMADLVRMVSTISRVNVQRDLLVLDAKKVCFGSEMLVSLLPLILQIMFFGISVDSSEVMTLFYIHNNAVCKQSLSNFTSNPVLVLSYHIKYTVIELK